MKYRALAVLALAIAIVGPTAASATDEQRYPIPEGGTVVSSLGGTCVSESVYDTDAYDPRVNPVAGAACRRLKVVFGPLLVKPGQNDILIQPVTYEKPRYDGYLVRFKPSLIDHSGFAPPVEQLHLHHGTWLNAGRSYGSGPWIATGEEKTIATWPKGFGLEVRATDEWLFLHMVHNAQPTGRAVWVTYDLDYIEKAAGDALGIKNTKGIWLDVSGGPTLNGGGNDSRTENYPFNPVTNTQKGFGHIDAESGTRVCTFPAENCARMNSSGRQSAQQGLPVESLGRDFKIPVGFLGGNKDKAGEGTLVIMGGHLHNGGIRDEVSLVRDLDGNNFFSASEERLIHISDAYYFDGADPTKVGAQPRSWDFAMSGQSADLGWRIRVKEGDVLRLNAVYDTDLASWYENMGIVMTWVAPGDLTGTDVFADGLTFGKGINSAVLDRGAHPLGALGTPEDPFRGTPGATHPVCTASATNVCVRGQITHGHYQAGNNHGIRGVTPLQVKPGPLVDSIPIGGFTYGIADLGIASVNGIPQVMAGTKLTFWNADTADNMWHTITRCALPCTGATTVDYPIPDGGVGSVTDVMDFDSSELGIGLTIPSRTMGLTGVALEWSITPPAGSEGVYTFYCRIHPSMRGAFQVVS